MNTLYSGNDLQINRMENRISDKQTKFASPKNNFKQLLAKNQLRSPKFLRRKQEAQNDCSINRDKRVEQKKRDSEMICYISPKKLLQSQSFATCSSKSLASQTSLKPTRQDSFKRLSSFQENYLTKLKKQSLDEPVNEQETIKRISVNNKSLGEENIELKECIEKLKKQLEQEKSTNQRLKEENQYLYTNIQDFKYYLSSKDQTITELERKIKQKEGELNRCKLALKDQRENVSNLQSIIETINKTTFDSSYRDTFENVSESTEDDVQDQQLQFYKTKVMELNQIVKYAQIYESIIPKLRTQIKEEREKNKSLRNSNNKLQAKVKNLLHEHDSKHKFYLDTIRKRVSDDEVSLELSPQK